MRHEIFIVSNLMLAVLFFIHSCHLKHIKMRKFNYTVSTSTLWTSFDFGVVEAENIEKATEKAIEKLNDDFKKANDAFFHCDITKKFTIEFNKDCVEITEEI